MTGSIFVGCVCVCVLLQYSPWCSCPLSRCPAGPVCTELSHSSASSPTSRARCCCTAPVAHKPCSGTAAALKSHAALCTLSESHIGFHLPLSVLSPPQLLGSSDLSPGPFFQDVHKCPRLQSIICQLTRRCWVYTAVTVCSPEGRFNESYSHWAAIVNERQEPLWRTCSFFMTYWLCCSNDHPVTKAIFSQVLKLLITAQVFVHVVCLNS